jgi:hypothetical protein
MPTFASVVTGKDPDLWLLVATILFAVACVICVSEKAWTMALVSAGLTFMALGFLVT